MTEAEWLASDDPAAMGQVVADRKRASPRVFRLYMAAFWAWQSQRLDTVEDRARLLRRAELVGEWAETGTAPPDATEHRFFVGFGDDPKAGFLSTVRAPGGWRGGEPAVARAVLLLREVFGNPFAFRRKRKSDPRRGSMFDKGWRTDTVLTLANQMYESREFGAMPILADALQDAGCDNNDILTHCRDSVLLREPPTGSPKPPPDAAHVRGCWVLDLVLGKG